MNSLRSSPATGGSGRALTAVARSWNRRSMASTSNWAIGGRYPFSVVRFPFQIKDDGLRRTEDGGGPPGLRSSFAFQSPQVDVGVVHVGHGICDEMMPGNIADRPVHGVGHGAVGRVTSRLTSELYEMKRLARAHLHDESDVVGEGDHVLGYLGSGVGAHCLVELPGIVHHRYPLIRQPMLDDVCGKVVAEPG